MEITRLHLELFSSYADASTILSSKLEFLLLTPNSTVYVDFRTIEDILNLIPDNVVINLTSSMTRCLVFEFIEISTMQILLQRDNTIAKHYIAFLKSHTGDIGCAVATLKKILSELH